MKKLHEIKYNGETYIQDNDGIIVEVSEYLRDLGPIHNYMRPELIDRINRLDASTTCKWCGTSYRQSDQRDTDRCPFCWRLI